MLAPFCEVAGVSVRANASAAVRKRILASLAFIENRERLHHQLFPDDHMDWAAVHEFLGHVAYTHAEWSTLLQLLQFVNEPAPRQHVADLVAFAQAGGRAPGPGAAVTATLGTCAPASGASAPTSGGGNAAAGPLSPVEAMRVCLARAKIQAPGGGSLWDLIGKCMVAANLTELEPATGLELVLEQAGATKEQVSELAQRLLTFRHSAADYSEAFARLLHPQFCQVRVHLVQEAVQRRDHLREVARQHATRTADAHRRPCLLEIVLARQQSEAAEGSGTEAPDTVAGFCRATHLAYNASARLKQIIYYLVCTGEHPDRSPQILRALGGDSGAHARVMQVTVVQPDIVGLCDAIMETQHSGAPSTELREFHQRCASGLCFIGAGRSVHWTTALRLYLAAYLRADAAREVWRRVLERTAQQRHIGPTQADAGAIFHHQTAAASESESVLQAFVREHPMALRDAVGQMLAN